MCNCVGVYACECVCVQDKTIYLWNNLFVSYWLTFIMKDWSKHSLIYWSTWLHFFFSSSVHTVNHNWLCPLNHLSLSSLQINKLVPFTLWLISQLCFYIPLCVNAFKLMRCYHQHNRGVEVPGLAGKLTELCFPKSLWRLGTKLNETALIQ